MAHELDLNRILNDALAAVRARTSLQPEVGLVLGSGLGGYADLLEERVEIPYCDLRVSCFYGGGAPFPLCAGQALRQMGHSHAGALPQLRGLHPAPDLFAHSPDEAAGGTKAARNGRGRRHPRGLGKRRTRCHC